MTRPRITFLREIGSNRPLCERTIRIAAGQATYEAQRQASKRARLGVPITQCAARADFRIDDVPVCRQHAGQEALSLLLGEQNRRDFGGPPMRPIVNQSWCPFVDEHLAHVQCAECTR